MCSIMMYMQVKGFCLICNLQQKLMEKILQLFYEIDINDIINDIYKGLNPCSNEALTQKKSVIQSLQCDFREKIGKW